MLIFRHAEMKDMDDIMRVVGEAQRFMSTLNIDQWQDGYPERETLEADVALRRLCLLEDGGRAAAFAALLTEPEPIYDAIDGAWAVPGPYLTIHRMALDDAHRGRGLAGEIVARAVTIAHENGCAAIRADTHPGNVAMRRFLEKRGFVYRGIVRYEVKKGDPTRVAYEKDLRNCSVPL